MKQFKCSNCGGQLEIGGAGGLVCPYCGAKTFMSDKDFRGNSEFRKLLLSYYKAEAEKKEFDYSRDILWHCSGRDSFVLESGQELNIDYMEKYDYNGVCCYVAKESAVYVFNSISGSERFLSNLASLSFPQADTKLPRCFPSLKLNVRLKGSGAVLAFVRRPNFYPAELFSPLPSTHLAWLISRMENICCALAFSGLEHGAISPDSIWINPETHEGALFGDWRFVKRSENNYGDLWALRKTAIRLAENTRSPKEMYRFLNSKPAKTAFDDFELWDGVIEDGFGGHKFVKM